MRELIVEARSAEYEPAWLVPMPGRASGLISRLTWFVLEREDEVRHCRVCNVRAGLPVEGYIPVRIATSYGKLGTVKIEA